MTTSSLIINQLPTGPGHTLSLDLQTGVCCALIEDSPSHRASLTRSLSLLAPVPPNCLHLCDVDPYHSLRQAQTLVGYCALRGALFEELSIGQYLSFFARVYGCYDDASLTAAMQVCKLQRIVDVRISKLDDTQKATVHLSRAILQDPPIFIFDGMEELSEHACKRVGRVLEELLAFGKVALVISSKFSAVERWCSQVAVLSCGEHLFTGPSEAVRQLRAFTGACADHKHAYEVRAEAPAEQLLHVLEPVGETLATQDRVLVWRNEPDDGKPLAAAISEALVNAGTPPTALIPLSEGPFAKRLRHVLRSE